MQKFLQFLILFTGILMSFSTTAETVTIPRDANIRSSKKFYGRENIVGQILQGTQVEILSSKKLRSGANALEVKIIAPENKVALNKKKPLYIWQSEKEIKQDLFKTEAGATCTNCNSEPVKAPSQTNDIQNIVNKIEEQQSVAIPAAVETAPAPTTGSLAEAIKTYSESPQVQRSFDWAKANIRRGNGMCYRHTKEALATKTRGGKGKGNNLIPAWFGGRDADQAKEGVGNLKKRGFINLLENDDYKNMTSKTAPHGSVLIYKHVNSKGVEDKKAGHAEIKFDSTNLVDGKTTSQYFYGPMHTYPANNRDGSRYILIGVMIKSPMEEGSN